MSDEKDKENEFFQANDIFGLSESRADEIKKAFDHAKIDNDTWTGVLVNVKKTLNLKTNEEWIYFGYVFGRMYEMDNTKKKMIDTLDRLGGLKR